MSSLIMQVISRLTDIAITDIKPDSSFEKLRIDDLELVKIIMTLEDKLDLKGNVRLKNNRITC